MDLTISTTPRVLIAEPPRLVARSLAATVSALGGSRIVAHSHTAAEALAQVENLRPDVALVDLELSPGCDLVSDLRRLSPETRVIAVSNPGDHRTRELVEALTSGAVGAVYRDAGDLDRALASSSLAAPIVTPEAAGLLLKAYVDLRADKRRHAVATIHALMAALEVRDFDTGQHLHRGTIVAMKCMERVDQDLARNEEVAYGYMLHDVGKIGVPDEILNKPGPLDLQEREVMRRHPEMGMKIIEPVGFSKATADVILNHHERWDGTGYPHRLSSEEIPLSARVFAVADAFDAMTSNRPYRPAMPRDDALGFIRESSGSAYDPDIVDEFIDLTAREAILI